MKELESSHRSLRPRLPVRRFSKRSPSTPDAQGSAGGCQAGPARRTPPPPPKRPGRRHGGAGRWWRCAVLVFLSPLCLGQASGKGPAPFGFADVAEQARRLASEPFKAPPAIPDFLARLSYDDYRDIRFDTAQSLWKD